MMSCWLSAPMAGPEEAISRCKMTHTRMYMGKLSSQIWMPTSKLSICLKMWWKSSITSMLRCLRIIFLPRTLRVMSPATNSAQNNGRTASRRCLGLSPYHTPLIGRFSSPSSSENRFKLFRTKQIGFLQEKSPRMTWSTWCIQPTTTTSQTQSCSCSPTTTLSPTFPSPHLCSLSCTMMISV